MLRPLLAVAAALVLAGGAYAAALETSMFAMRRIEVSGGGPAVQAELRAAFRPDLGRSLLRIGAGEVARRIAPLPDVVSVGFDRRFPNTLALRVRPERPVLLLRRGKSGTWLVSARGRVMRRLRTARLSSLPRTWISTRTRVSVGEILPPLDGQAAAAAVAPLAPDTFPAPVRFVVATASQLTLRLRSGLEIRLGDLGDLRLKIAIARRILAAVHADAATAGYLDVSVPERPVLRSPNTQVSTTA